jgi:hypothetical protein
MKPLLWVGLIVFALGLGSFFVKLPHTETQTLSAGGMSVGMESTHSQTLPATASVAMVLVGMILAVGGLVPKLKA